MRPYRPVRTFPPLPALLGAALALGLALLGQAARSTAPAIQADAVPEWDHTSMLEVMRRGEVPRMTERMDTPAWRSLREPGSWAELERHQRQVDRMLGRRP